MNERSVYQELQTDGNGEISTELIALPHLIFPAVKKSDGFEWHGKQSMHRVMLVLQSLRSDPYIWGFSAVEKKEVDDCETQDHLGKHGTHTMGIFRGGKDRNLMGIRKHNHVRERLT